MTGWLDARGTDEARVRALVADLSGRRGPWVGAGATRRHSVERQIAEESLHASEVEKMLRPPGVMTPFTGPASIGLRPAS